MQGRTDKEAGHRRKRGGGRDVHGRKDDILVELPADDDLSQRDHHLGWCNHRYAVNYAGPAQEFEQDEER
jgi:hypothetical protein